jgi:hypothetical protein
MSLILWYSWLAEINKKQSELGAACINIEKLRQQEHFMVAEIELLKVQKRSLFNCKRKTMLIFLYNIF